MRILPLVMLLAACTPPEKPQPPVQTVATVVFRGVTVFDGTGSVGQVDLAVDEDRIVLVGPRLHVTSSAQIVDGTGQTLLPAIVEFAEHLEVVANDPATLAASIAAAKEHGKRAVVAATTLAEARAAVEAGADGLIGVFTDAPVDEGFLALAAQRGVFVIATLPAAETVKPELVNNIVAMRGRVPILAGPGPEQLARLVAAGFLPEEAIAAATSVPAQLFGLTDRGRIAEGMRADLMLVDGDPLADITVMGKVVGVWRGGVSAGTP